MDLESVKTLINESTLNRDSRGDVLVLKCPKEEQLLSKEIWIFQNFTERGPIVHGKWYNFGRGRMEYTMEIESLNSQTFKFGANVFFYDEISSDEICSRVQVVGNDGFSCVSEWLSISRYLEASDARLPYRFDTSCSSTLSQVSIPTGTIPTFTVKNLLLHDILVVMIEFASLQSQLDCSSRTTNTKPTRDACKKLHDDKEFTDVEVVVAAIGDDGSAKSETIMAHKAVLATQSEVFMKKLTTDMVERDLSRIEIKDFEPQVIREGLKYMYTEEADLEKYAVQLLKFSDKYNLPELFDLCQSFIGTGNYKIISPLDWEILFDLIGTYKDRVAVLENGVKKYLKKNITTLKDVEDFQKAVGRHPDVFLKIMY